jgi:septum formation protein
MSQQKNNLNIILASGSPRRKQLLADLGLPFEVITSRADEEVDETVSPAEYVSIIAKRKADAVLQMMKDKGQNHSLIISADTTVVIDGQILGKPGDTNEACAMLQKLQGKKHKVYTAICLLDTNTGNHLIDYRETLVEMKSLTREQIEAYVRTQEPMDKAGAYAIQGIGATLISGIVGDYFNVVGLSLSLLDDMLTKMGHPILSAAHFGMMQDDVTQDDAIQDGVPQDEVTQNA